MAQSGPDQATFQLPEFVKRLRYSNRAVIKYTLIEQSS